MKRLFFDIETTLNPGVIDLMPEPAAPANLKDPEKIAAAIEEKKREMIEKAALDADYGRILSIGYSTGEWVQVMLNDDVYPDAVANTYSEKEMLETFWRLFKECGGACVGYNILGFDLPYLMRRSMALGVKLPFIPNLAKYRTEPITDLMMIIYNWGSDKYKSLKQVAKLYGIENAAPDVDGSMVAGLDADQLIAYQISDVKMVMALYEKMNGVYFVHR
jgi:DNA polymerase elongation subunit (family B)